MTILHVDMDAFYASVEERENPKLKGHPLVVGGDPKARGVVAAANYEARKFAVHSAMPMANALRLCPQLIWVRPRMDLYVQVSAQLREIFSRYTPLIEPLSLDEAFLDVSDSESLFNSAGEIALGIKSDVRRELRLIASVGVAPNKFLAKLASDLGKPDGLLEVPTDSIQEFLDPLPVSRLWGVGQVAQKRLQQLGVETIAGLRRCSPAHLQAELGKWAGQLLELAQGIDHRQVQPHNESKSISHETTFDRDISDVNALRSYLFDLTEQVASRARHKGYKGRTVHLKLRYGDFRTLTRSHSMTSPSNSSRDLWQHVLALFDRAVAARPGQFRLIGMGISALVNSDQSQGDLFADEQVAQAKRLDQVADAINDRFGHHTLQRGAGLRR